MTILAALLAALVGISLGLLGGGGSILVVPILTYALGYDPKQAIAMSLGVVGATSLVGAVGHWRLGQVNLRVALLFATGAMATAYLGARLAGYVSGAVQLTCFAVMMLLAAAFMLLSRPTARPSTAESGEPGSARRLAIAPILLQGSGVGLLTGLLGVGGGFLIVPALTLLAKVPMKQAVGTSLLVISLNALAGFIGYVGVAEIPWGTLAGLTAMTIGGIAGGTFLSRYARAEPLRRAFALFLIVVGAFVLYQNRDVVLSLA